MLILSSFFFVAGGEALSDPVPLKIQLPVVSSLQSSAVSPSVSPARKTAFQEHEYQARLKQFANKTDGLSLVSAKNKKEKEEAERLLDMLKTFPSRSVKAQDLKKYEPVSESDATIADEFDIIASDSTGATLDGRYRVKKKGEEAYYNLVVCNVRTVAIRNAFMAELLKAYIGRKEIFKEFLEKQVSIDPSTVVASGSSDEKKKTGEHDQQQASGAIGQEQQQQRGPVSPSTGEAPSVEAVLKQIEEASTLAALKEIVEKANLSTEPQLDPARQELAALEDLARRIQAVKVQTELDATDRQLTERQRQLLVSEMQAASARFSAAVTGKTGQKESAARHTELWRYAPNRTQLFYVGALTVAAVGLLWNQERIKQFFFYPNPDKVSNDSAENLSAADAMTSAEIKHAASSALVLYQKQNFAQQVSIVASAFAQKLVLPVCIWFIIKDLAPPANPLNVALDASLGGRALQNSDASVAWGSFFSQQNQQCQNNKTLGFLSERPDSLVIQAPEGKELKASTTDASSVSSSIPQASFINQHGMKLIISMAIFVMTGYYFFFV